MNERDALDDAIDRSVRDMTYVAADDEGVARVMARVREAGVRDASAAEGQRWMLAPRLAFAGAGALLLVAMAAVYSVYSSYSVHSPRSLAPIAGERRVAMTVPTQPSLPSRPSLPPRAIHEFPTRVAPAPSTMQATTERMTPIESDIAIASITPAPLGDAPAIAVAPLTTTALTVEAIELPAIDMPPVSPEQQE